ncbi:hypothetical protein CRE_17743 [Caenorhabditis remanei]|uniref:Uncharacterized protein n=1 Tax=Caenorhabditis remanei TaxID=31234 RepID=E3NR93_CAERE|nr:hypothetical protein CRE_17743 [Caenorhabditis remanei]
MNNNVGNKPIRARVELSENNNAVRDEHDIDSSGNYYFEINVGTENCCRGWTPRVITSHSGNDVSHFKDQSSIAKISRYSKEETRSHSFQSAIEKRSKAKLYKMKTKEAVNVYLRRLQARIERKKEHIVSATKDLEVMMSFERETHDYTPVSEQNLYSPLFAYPEHI